MWELPKILVFSDSTGSSYSWVLVSSKGKQFTCWKVNFCHTERVCAGRSQWSCLLFGFVVYNPIVPTVVGEMLMLLGPGPAQLLCSNLFQHHRGT